MLSLSLSLSLLTQELRMAVSKQGTRFLSFTVHSIAFDVFLVGWWRRGAREGLRGEKSKDKDFFPSSSSEALPPTCLGNTSMNTTRRLLLSSRLLGDKNKF